MEIAEFQKLSVRTLNNKLTMNEQLANMVIGATGEFCGEVADNIKKYLYCQRLHHKIPQSLL